MSRSGRHGVWAPRDPRIVIQGKPQPYSLQTGTSSVRVAASVLERFLQCYVLHRGCPSCEGKRSVKTNTIVVVDDNPFIAGLLEDLLTNVPGYHVVTIDDGEAAHDQIVADPPDLIILDVHLPRMNGFALYDELRRTPTTAGVPILLMSAAMPHPELARRGILDYVRKPFDVEDLLARVHAALYPPQTIH